MERLPLPTLLLFMFSFSKSISAIVENASVMASLSQKLPMEAAVLVLH